MKTVLLLLANGFEIFEASVFIDVFGWNLHEGDRSTKLVSCAINKQIRSAFGQSFIVDCTLDEINVDDFAGLAIPGGFEEYDFYRDAFSQEFSAIINEFDRQKKPIFTVCTGALPIAKAGVLRGRKGTTYNLNPIRQETLRSFGVEVVNEPIVTDGNITTSWNPSTAMEVAFLMLERLTSQPNAREIRRRMGFR